jgi:cell division septation protein DedD
MPPGRRCILLGTELVDKLMSYDFSFDKKSIFFILGGSVAIGALLFFAGFIVGWDRGTDEARLEFQKQNPAAPVVAKAKTTPASVAPAPAETKTATDSQAAPPKDAPSNQQTEQKSLPAPELKAAAKPSPAESEKKPETQASASSATIGEEPSTQKEPSAQKESLAQKKASSAAQADADEASGFSLQIGAFQNEDNALRCKSSLKSRGYAVFVFNTLDAAGRTWHTVRMGHYPSVDKASAAAAVFTTKERLPVFIRPVNEL